MIVDGPPWDAPGKAKEVAKFILYKWVAALDSGPLSLSQVCAGYSEPVLT